MRLVGIDDRSDGSGSASGALVAAAIRGERDAMRQVWEDQRRWVAAVLMAHKPRQTYLEDLLQDVAMQFVRRIHELRDPGALRPWLRTVAMNAAHASGRTVVRRRRDVIEMRPAVASGGEGLPDRKPDLLTGRREEARRLMELSERLPDGYREPLLLRCLQGMSYRSIGDLMGLPETTIETRIARGRRMLRELAEKEMNQSTSAPGSAGAQGVIENKSGGAKEAAHTPKAIKQLGNQPGNQDGSAGETP